MFKTFTITEQHYFKQFMGIANTLVLAFVVLMWSGHVAAEGNCPPGYYPIGGQGLQGCAPIPSGGSNGGGGGGGGTYKWEPSLWEKRWGAIAEDKAAPSRPTGYAQATRTERGAKKVALENCQKKGGKNCEVIFTYNNKCVALADPTQGGQESVIRIDRTPAGAKALAAYECQSKNKQECKVVYSACSTYYEPGASIFYWW